VAVSGAGRSVLGPALVAGPAELLADDLLEDALERQLDPQPCDLLQRAGQVDVAGEQLMDPSADRLGG
jgi:hypothetical protein